MADLLTTSVTGMRSFQRVLDVTGHNIANANTPGYSRQIAELSSLPGQSSGAGFIGSGVKVSTVRRVYDSLLADQLRSAVTTHNHLDAMHSLGGQLDSLLANPETGLSPSLQSFFSSVQDAAGNPASLPARQAMLGESEGLVRHFQSLDTQLRRFEDDINGRLQQVTTDVNRLASSIAAINDEIVLAQGRTGQPPNDLLDQRDSLINELASQISVATVPQDDGAINLFVGSGQTLVIGAEAHSLAVRGNEFDPTRLEVVYRSSGGDVPFADGAIGGAIGGLLESRSLLIDPARRTLGETALALAMQFNEQHASGFTLRGAMGGEYFGIGDATVLSSSGNTGNAAVTATVSDVSALAEADYILSYDGAAFSLSNAATGEIVPMSGSGDSLDPFLAEGLRIAFGGTPVAGDRFLISGSRNAVADLTVSVADVQDIALAGATRTATSSSNIGNAEIGPSEVVDRNDPQLLSSSVIEFLDANTYSVNGSGAFAYQSGEPIVVNGSQFAITGSPAAGDQFTIEANAGGTGDNRNGRLLADIQTQGVLQGGTIGVSENYGRLIADVGSTTRHVQASLDAQGVILSNVEDTIASKSGVNLDEEAARLLQFQQAYQAVAQVVAITSTLFDTLIAAVRR